MSRVGRWMLSIVARRLRAQAAVETAAVFAILVPVIVGAVDLGRAYFAYDLADGVPSCSASWPRSWSASR